MARTWPNNAANYLKIGANPSVLNMPGNSEQFTLAAWIKLNSNGAADQTFFSKYSGTQGPLLRTISGKLRQFWIDTPGLSGHEAIGSTTMSTGTWYHIASTWPRSTSPGMQVWLNGAVDGTDATNATMSTTDDTVNGWTLGVRGNGGGAKTNPLDGVMAHAAMWNIALSAAEIAALAKGYSPWLVSPHNLRGYWPIYGAAAPEVDMTGNGNNFTLVGTLNAADHAPVGPPLPPSTSDFSVYFSTTATGNPPVNTVAPTVSPAWPEVSRQVSADPGTWTGDVVIAYTYQWQAADQGGGAFADIPGAASATYRVDRGYLNKFLRARVQGTNGAGSAVAYSGSVGWVTDSPGSAYASAAVG